MIFVSCLKPYIKSHAEILIACGADIPAATL
jgi:hypothetical protein